jgi:hypothetical protein
MPFKKLTKFIEMMKLLFEAIVPGWNGRELPLAFPWHVRLFFRLSFLLPAIFSLMQHGKSFSKLSIEERESLLMKLYHHRSGSIRSLVQFWKLTALMTQ